MTSDSDIISSTSRNDKGDTRVTIIMNKILHYVSRKPATDELPFIPAWEVKQRNGKDYTDLCMSHWRDADSI